DLSNYANPGKVWRRLGSAPFESGGVVHAGKAWRCLGGLSAEEWSAYGYSKRPYKKRYEEAKETFAKRHPDYRPCWIDDHAVRMAGKMLLRNLWREWKRTAGVRDFGTE